MGGHERHQLPLQELPARHPLVVASAPVVVRAVEPTRGEDVLQPEEELLVAYVHPQRHLGLTTVASEMPFPDQEPQEEADREVVEALPGGGYGWRGLGEAL